MIIYIYEYIYIYIRTYIWTCNYPSNEENGGCDLNNHGLNEDLIVCAALVPLLGKPRPEGFQWVHEPSKACTTEIQDRQLWGSWVKHGKAPGL